MKFNLRSLTLLYVFICLIYSCENEEFINDKSAKLSFSEDTVFFDTVFSSIGSTTKQLRIYNKHNKTIKVSNIYLAKGDNSVFRLNIDGNQSHRVENVKIPPKDSLYIFIEVTIDPNGGNLPMVVQDSIVFITNDNFQDIDIMAWGQDIHLFNGDTITSQTWIADKPYLIINNLYVDSLHTLTIEEGVQVHLHRLASLVIYGSLQVNGTKDAPVVFQGDRLEELYDEIPGQWGTIAIVKGSVGSVINYAEIKNAIAGFQIGDFYDERIVEATIKNTVIRNTTAAGLYSFGAKINGYNLIIGECGSASLALLKGGNYNFYHCTLANFGNFSSSSSDPSVFLTNFFFYRFVDYEINIDTTLRYYQDLVNANFVNCIIYGGNKNEFDYVEDEDFEMNYKFDHCLMKLIADSFDVNNTNLFNSVIINEDPKFVSATDFNFHLDTLSIAKDAGNTEIINLIPELEFDFEGESRSSDPAPDLGAFERIE